jgi:hypothetical protein
MYGRHGPGDGLVTCCIMIWTDTYARVVLGTSPAPLVWFVVGVWDGSPSQFQDLLHPAVLPIYGEEHKFSITMRDLVTIIRRCDIGYESKIILIVRSDQDRRVRHRYVFDSLVSA